MHAGADSQIGAAFYRGADACILCFSVIDRKSLRHLADWVAEFRARCPVDDNDEMTWICVGTKLDLKDLSTGEDPVSQEEAQAFLDSLLPPFAREEEEEDESRTPTLRKQDFVLPVSKPPHYSTEEAVEEHERRPRALDEFPATEEAIEDPPTSASSIDIIIPPNFHKRRRSEVSRGRSTVASIYHTPSGSITNSSWISNGRMPSPPLEPADLEDEPGTPRPLTPSLDLPNGHLHEEAEPTSDHVEPPRPERGIKLFLSSSKTGFNVEEPFDYCARHIYARQRYSNWIESQRPQGEERGIYGNLHPGRSAGPLKVGAPESAAKRKWTSGCC
jgi:Ras-related protein Rab-7A